MDAKQAGATHASEESANTESEATQKTGSFAAELLKVAKEEGHEVGEPTAQSESEVEQEEQDTDEAVESEKESESEEQEQSEESTEQDESEEEETESEESKDDKPKGARQEWPEDAKARIAEETSKRKRRTQERDDAISELQEVRQERDVLRANLSRAQRPVPTGVDPLADVHDEQALQDAETQIESVLAFAEKHHEGAEGVVIGKDAQGNEIVQDFTPEQIADIKIAAERRLRKEIPQRRALLVQRAQMDSETVKVYPDFKNPESQLTQEASQILRQIPELLRFPDALFWIGDALTGRATRLAKAKEGKNGKSGNLTVDRIVESSKTKLAPSATKSRAFASERRGADLNKFEKRLEEKGDAESAEAYVGAIFSKRKSGKTDLVS